MSRSNARRGTVVRGGIASTATRFLDDDEKGVALTDTVGGAQEI